MGRIQKVVHGAVERKQAEQGAGNSKANRKNLRGGQENDNGNHEPTRGMGKVG